MVARGLVRVALEDLYEDDPRGDVLEPILKILWEGIIPVDALKALAEEWEHYVSPGEEGQEQPVISDGELLDQEFRQLAAQMPQEDWHTTFYESALAAVDEFEAGNEEAFWVALADMRDRLDQAWSPYSQCAVVEKEVTAETVVGHRMLQDGVENWFQALDELERAAQGEIPFEDGLTRGEQANRLLVAVKRLNQRVQAHTPWR